MSRYKIAIIGAGPAGCTLARLLLHKNVDVDVIIFEGEKALNARTQGGSLDLHTKTGLKAMQECGLYDEFIKHARFDAEAFRICNKHFQSFVHFQGTKDASHTRGRPEIDRIQLRQILLNSLPADLIRWDHHLDSIEQQSESGGYILNFRDRVPETGFDLVVGADGCWSHVRSLLTDEKPHYARVSGVGFTIMDPKQRCPEIYNRVNKGSLFSFGDGKALMAQQLGSGNMNVMYWGVHPEDWVKQFEGTSIDGEATAARDSILRLVEGWDPRLRGLLEAADGQPIPRNLFMLPVGNTWSSRPGVTLLGDAAHVMTPFAGEGVNLAMMDALKLAAAIETAVKQGSTTEVLMAQIEAYEQDLFARAKVVQQMTLDMMNAGFFDEGGLDKNIEKYVATAAGDEIPGFLKPLFGFGVRRYFDVWRWRNPLPRDA